VAGAIRCAEGDRFAARERQPRDCRAEYDEQRAEGFAH
jgi:hypothetical protein